MDYGINGTVLLFLLLGLAALTVALLGLFLATLRVRRKKKKEAPTPVDFVVGTFHELVSQLKEKERELDVLRERAEERAGRIEDYNENILQSVPSGVVSMDGQWRVVKVNSSAERILGLRAAEVIGRDGREVFPPEFLKSARERGESRFVTSSGKRLWLGFSLTPLRDGAGSTIGQLLVFTDLTGLKALEAQAELRDRLSSLGEMAAGIAHELRNPMGVISGYMRLLGQRVDEPSRDIVEAVNGEVSTMNRIISDFLSFARPGELRVAEVDLAELVNECVEGLGADPAGPRLTVEVTGGLVIEADRVKMRQALTNLLLNAREATSRQGRIRVTGVDRQGAVELAVSDTGHGIPEGVRDRMFLPFYTTKEQGTGLGLAIVHRIVVEHGGSIEVESGQEGTSFRITLPRKARPGERSAASG